MDEIGMKSEDEGVCLKQLIPFYKKYRLSFHCLDYKYNVAASHNDYDYKTNTNYAALFYAINDNHLFPITNREEQRAIAQINTNNTKRFIAREKTYSTPSSYFYTP